MIAPALPVNEPERLATLRALNILDTPAEERFDRVTRLAKRLFGVPAVIVSLVDAQRQWFKSRQGLEATETPRDVSFCGHTILGDDILHVPDATKDERFHDNPLVTGSPAIRFYAGCPLTVSPSSTVGTLCLLDWAPRGLDDEERQLLKDLAGMVEQELAALELATMDELTQLSNRRGFASLAQQALGTCRRTGGSATAMFFDLDGFKRINDRFGHAEGDRALVDFARLLKATYRDCDVLGRLGGDEFVVLLTGCDYPEATATTARLKAAVAERNAPFGLGRELRFSVGIVEYSPESHSDIFAVLGQADGVMYSQKQARRVSRRSS